MLGTSTKRGRSCGQSQEPARLHSGVCDGLITPQEAQCLAPWRPLFLTSVYDRFPHCSYLSVCQGLTPAELSTNCCLPTPAALPGGHILNLFPVLRPCRGSTSVLLLSAGFKKLHSIGSARNLCSILPHPGSWLGSHISLSRPPCQLTFAGAWDAALPRPTRFVSGVPWPGPSVQDKGVHLPTLHGMGGALVSDP